MEPRIIIQDSMNLGQRLFHTTSVISCSQIEVIKAPLQEYAQEYLNKIGGTGTVLLKKILNIPGVEEVCIQLHTLTVTLNPAFDWGDVESEVIAALKDTFSLDEKGNINFRCLLERFGSYREKGKKNISQQLSQD